MARRLNNKSKSCLSDTLRGGAAPTPQASKATANRPGPLQAGARSTRRGLRVEAVNSFEGGFVWGLKSWIRHPAARPTRHAPWSGGLLQLIQRVQGRWV